MPPRGSVREAKEFAQKHGGWIAARLKRLPEATPFADGTEVPLRGIAHRIVHRRGERGTVWTEESSCGDRLLCVAGGPAHVNRRINDFLKREAVRHLAQAFVLDYLAAHEVCHLVELNHSPRFWRLVTRLHPQYERAKTWLDVHGADLHRYGLPVARTTNEI
jgi:predicted metal-dependent hydrolase